MIQNWLFDFWRGRFFGKCDLSNDNYPRSATPTDRPLLATGACMVFCRTPTSLLPWRRWRCAWERQGTLAAVQGQCRGRVLRVNLLTDTFMKSGMMQPGRRSRLLVHSDLAILARRRPWLHGTCTCAFCAQSRSAVTRGSRLPTVRVSTAGAGGGSRATVAAPFADCGLTVRAGH